MYKIVNGKIAVNIPEYIGGPTRVTRSYHSYKYNNFFTRTRKEWNTLPPFLLDQLSVDAFKSTVTNYLSSHWNYLLLSSTIYLIFVASNSTAFFLCVCFFIFHMHIHSDGKPFWIIKYKLRNKEIKYGWFCPRKQRNVPCKAPARARTPREECTNDEATVPPSSRTWGWVLRETKYEVIISLFSLSFILFIHWTLLEKKALFEIYLCFVISTSNA